MPKITGKGTPSIDGVPPQEFDQGRFFNKGEKDSPEVAEEEKPSAGTNSQPSDDSKPKTPRKQSASATTHRPARTTANRSK